MVEKNAPATDAAGIAELPVHPVTVRVERMGEAIFEYNFARADLMPSDADSMMMALAPFPDFARQAVDAARAAMDVIS